jgi:putative ABC transport system permease protein
VVTVLGLAWRTITARRGSFAGAFVALLCSSALVGACGLLMQSGIASGIQPQRLAGADVVVVAPRQGGVTLSNTAPLAVTSVAEVASVPGVREAVADISVPVNVVGQDDTLVGGAEAGPPLGHGWSSAQLGPLIIADGRPPRSADEVVLDRGLAATAGVEVGGDIQVAVGSTPATYRVVGVLGPPPSVDELRQAALFFTDGEAARLSGRPDSVAAIGVLADPGVDPDELGDAVTARLGGSVEAVSGVSRGDVEFRDAGAATELLLALSGAFGGIAAMTAMFVVASTLGLVVQQRRREFALLRAIAATPKQVHRMIGAEIFLVSLAAAVPGAVASLGVVWLLRAAFTAIDAVPTDYGLSFGPIPLLVAVVLTMLTARVAGWMSARRALKIRPVEALGEAAVETARLGFWRTLIGVIVLGGGLAMSMVPLLVPDAETGAALSSLSSLVLVIGMALLGPRIVQLAIILLGPFVRMSASVSGYLAAKNTRANSRRLASAVVPLVLAITVMVVQISVGRAQIVEVERQTDRGLTADFVVASTGTGISPDLVRQIQRVPGVGTATPVVRGQTVLRYEERPGSEQGAVSVHTFATQGVEPDRLTETMDLDVRAGSTDDLSGQAVALSQVAANQAHTGVGGKVVLFLGDGARIEPTVVAVYGRGMGFGDVLLPRELMLAHAPERLDTSVLVRAAPGTDRDALAGRLDALARDNVGVLLADRDALVLAEKDALSLNNWTNVILLIGLFGYIAINVANTLIMATSERRREFALLRLVGTSEGQVLRMMRTEAFVVVVIAVVISTLLSLPPLIGVSLGLSEGETATPVLSVPAYLLTVAGTALLGLLSIMIPTRVALRAKPVEVIGLRE